MYWYKLFFKLFIYFHKEFIAFNFTFSYNSFNKIFPYFVDCLPKSCALVIKETAPDVTPDNPDVFPAAHTDAFSQKESFSINYKFLCHSIFFITIGRASINILPVLPHSLIAGMDFVRNIPGIPLIDDIFQGHGQIRPLTVRIKIVIHCNIPYMEQRKYPLNVRS